MNSVIERDARGGELVLVPREILTRLEVEQFLFREAALIDAWKLDDWLALFDENATYEIPAPDAADPENVSPATAYFVIADNYERLAYRVKRIQMAGAHAESPRSKVKHIYSNVVIEHDSGEDVCARVNFVVFRTKRGTATFFGHSLYDLRRGPDGLKIKRKRAIFDFDDLVPQGKVSIII